MKALLIATAAALFAFGAQAATPEEALTKGTCMGCHSKDKKMMGPTFKDIAAKYKGKDVTTTLMEKVRKGGSGSFGPIPMIPNGPEKISDTDLKAAVEWILKS